MAYVKSESNYQQIENMQPVSLIKDIAEFKAEVAAIHLCAEKMKRAKTYQSYFFGQSNNIKSSRLHTELLKVVVWDWVRAQNELGSKVTQTTTEMKKLMNWLNKLIMSFICPNLFCGNAK